MKLESVEEKKVLQTKKCPIMIFFVASATSGQSFCRSLPTGLAT